MNNQTYITYYIDGHYDFKRNAVPAIIRGIKVAANRVIFAYLYARYIHRYKKLPDLS